MTPEFNGNNTLAIGEVNLPPAQLRRRLTEFTRGIRVSAIPETASLTEPQSQKSDTVLFEDRMVTRKRIVLLAARCSTATCTMCPLPNEALNSHLRPQTADNIIKQFDGCFVETPMDDHEMITVYNNGNFFADAEMPPEARKHIYERVADSKSEILLVESLPQFIDEAKMEEAKEYLGDKRLVVAIGLQSADDMVRQLAINSTCTRVAFEKAVRLLNENNYSTQAFLMIKPPFLTENEAIEDTVKSIKYLSDLGIKNPILCATRVAPNTLVDYLYQEGEFRSPWLWSIAEVLRRSSEISPDCLPRVVTGELKPGSNPDSVVPANCPTCNDGMVAALERYNSSRDLRELNLTCSCQDEYVRQMETENNSRGKIPLVDRVSEFLDQHTNVRLG